jgi:hypothetical protein
MMATVGALLRRIEKLEKPLARPISRVHEFDAMSDGPGDDDLPPHACMFVPRTVASEDWVFVVQRQCCLVYGWERRCTGCGYPVPSAGICYICHERGFDHGEI